MLKAALIDHHDSFTYNVKAWLAPRFDVSVFSAEEISSVTVDDFDLIVLSPGPKTPQDYPWTLQFLSLLPATKPVLGICLGLQMMTMVELGNVSPYYPPLHGKKTSLTSSIPELSGLAVARYHSLKCDVPTCFEILATSGDLAMIVQHKNKNWLGYQFHPESFLTEKAEKFLSFAERSLLR